MSRPNCLPLRDRRSLIVPSVIEAPLAPHLLPLACRLYFCFVVLALSECVRYLTSLYLRMFVVYKVPICYGTEDLGEGLYRHWAASKASAKSCTGEDAIMRDYWVRYFVHMV